MFETTPGTIELRALRTPAPVMAAPAPWRPCDLDEVAGALLEVA